MFLVPTSNAPSTRHSTVSGDEIGYESKINLNIAVKLAHNSFRLARAY